MHAPVVRTQPSSYCLEIRLHDNNFTRLNERVRYNGIYWICLISYVSTETLSETFHLQHRSALESATSTPSREAKWRPHLTEIQPLLCRIRFCHIQNILRYLTEAFGELHGGLIEQC